MRVIGLTYISFIKGIDMDAYVISLIAIDCVLLLIIAYRIKKQQMYTYSFKTLVGVTVILTLLIHALIILNDLHN